MLLPGGKSDCAEKQCVTDDHAQALQSTHALLAWTSMHLDTAAQMKDGSFFTSCYTPNVPHTPKHSNGGETPIHAPPGRECTLGFHRAFERGEALLDGIELQGLPAAFRTRRRGEDNLRSTQKCPQCTCRAPMTLIGAKGQEAEQCLSRVAGRLTSAEIYHCAMGTLLVMAIQFR